MMFAGCSKAFALVLLQGSLYSSGGFHVTSTIQPSKCLGSLGTSRHCLGQIRSFNNDYLESLSQSSPSTDPSRSPGDVGESAGATWAWRDPTPVTDPSTSSYEQQLAMYQAQLASSTPGNSGDSTSASTMATDPTTSSYEEQLARFQGRTSNHGVTTASTTTTPPPRNWPTWDRDDSPQPPSGEVQHLHKNADNDTPKMMITDWPIARDEQENAPFQMKNGVIGSSMNPPETRSVQDSPVTSSALSLVDDVTTEISFIAGVSSSGPLAANPRRFETETSAPSGLSKLDEPTSTGVRPLGENEPAPSYWAMTEIASKSESSVLPEVASEPPIMLPGSTENGGGAANSMFDWSSITGFNGIAGLFNKRPEGEMERGDGAPNVLLDRSSSFGGFNPFAGLFDKPAQEVTEPLLDTKGMTQRIMKRIVGEGQATGAGGATTWEAFQRVEASWAQLKASKPFQYDQKSLGGPWNGIPPPTQFVTQDATVGNPQCWAKLREQRDKKLDYDVVVCGGTLGIFFATALQLKGHRVSVVETGKLRGREQEWNISMEELLHLVKMGVLTQEDIDAAVKTEFGGCRSGFKTREVTPLTGGYFSNGIGYECFTPDVLNLGVAPAVLIERAATRFRELGGVIHEETAVRGVALSDMIGASIDLGVDRDPMTARLVIDCMGNGSPITRQQRYGMKPDGICAVVGSCAAGYDKETNVQGDIIYTNRNIEDKGTEGMMQYFWESFPVGIGRNGNEPGSSDVKTTYMFTYMDADEHRPSLETLMEDYWKLLPIYQPSIKNPETDLEIKRVLFAYFPTYRDSPLKPRWSRILAIGDASGIQSPLSFGGFGALTRHLERLSCAISEALESDLLHSDDLARINPYSPNLSASWMFQKAMSVRLGQRVSRDFVNRLLAVNFEVMDQMGQRTIKPFLQDVIRFDGLLGSLSRSFLTDPFFMPQIVAHVGLPTLVEWLGHVGMMGYYGMLAAVVSPVVEPFVRIMKDRRTKFEWRRRIEAWKYGSGNDYILPKVD